jgi:transposase
VPNEVNSVSSQLFVGVDISAATFSAAQAKAEAKPQKAVDYVQNQEDFNKFQKDLLASGLTASSIMVVMEATGNYWLGLALALRQAGFRVSVINPAQAHNYAKALLLRPKNDQLDAQTLARFAQTQKPELWTPPPQVYYELQQRLCQRQDLIGMRGQLSNQLHALTAGPIVVESVKARLLQLIFTIDQQIAELDEEIKKVAQKADKSWAKSIELLQTIPGIGLLTACWLVALSLNLTACKKGASLAHFAGLAPVERRSGTSVRGYPQVGGGGHAQLRKLLYMAALSACRFNPLLKAFYEKLKEQGKAPKVARCAVARRLAVLAFGVVKSGKAFEADYAFKQKATRQSLAS